MSGALTVSDDRIKELGELVPELTELKNRSEVHVSGVRTVQPTGDDQPRHQANLATFRASAMAGIPHLVMLDSLTHPQATEEIRATGAIVVPMDETEAGLAKPSIIGAQLVDAYAARNALYVRYEGEKPLNASPTARGFAREAAKYDIVIGKRTKRTWDTMPYYLRTTEAGLTMGLHAITGNAFDYCSGVVALSAEGRELFYTVKRKDWGYLVLLPAWARANRLSAASVDAEWDYFRAVVEQENGNQKMNKKRRDQILAMRDAGTEAKGGLRSLSQEGREAYELLDHLASGLEDMERAA